DDIIEFCNSKHGEGISIWVVTPIDFLAMKTIGKCSIQFFYEIILSKIIFKMLKMILIVKFRKDSGVAKVKGFTYVMHIILINFIFNRERMKEFVHCFIIEQVISFSSLWVYSSYFVVFVIKITCFEIDRNQFILF